MRPILFEKNATIFTSNGLGRLSDATEATVVEEVNGEYTLTVSCPAHGSHVEDVQKGRILLAKPNDTDQAQPFRIVGIHKNLSGGITITARHISYDTRKIVVAPITSASISQFITTLPTKLLTTNGFASFSVTSTLTRDGTFYKTEPVTLRSLLSADDESVLTVYGAEAKYDRYSISILARRGSDKGVTMRYGKNLVSLETDENDEDIYTTILPYYTDNEGGCVYGALCTAAGYSEFGAGAVPVNVSSYLTVGQSTRTDTWLPTTADVTAAGALWLVDNKPYVPQRQIAVTPAELEGINTVELGDTVRVIFPALNLSESYRIARLTYDVLMERVTGVDLMLDQLSTGKPMKWIGQLSGVASALKGESDKLNKKISEAKTLSSQLANGTYKGGSFMDDDNLFAPHLWGGATLNVGQKSPAVGPVDSVAGKYNFNVDSDGSLRIGPMAVVASGSSGQQETNEGQESKDPSVVYKFDFDVHDNKLSLSGNYAIHNSAGEVIGYMGRIIGNPGGSSSSEGIALTIGSDPQSVSDMYDSFFLATDQGVRMNYKGQKIYASLNYIVLQSVFGPTVTLGLDDITLQVGQHYIQVNRNGAYYDGWEIQTNQPPPSPDPEEEEEE